MTTTPKEESEESEPSVVDATGVIEGAFRALLRAGRMPDDFKAIVFATTKSQQASPDRCHFEILWNATQEEIWLCTPDARIAPEEDVVETVFENDDETFSQVIAAMKQQLADRGSEPAVMDARFTVLKKGDDAEVVLGMFRASYSNGMSALILTRFGKPADGKVPEDVVQSVVADAKAKEVSVGGTLVSVHVSLGNRQIYP